MGQHCPLIWWILVLYINITLLKKKIEREGGITGLSEVTVILGYLIEIDVSVDPFFLTMDLLLSTG